MYEYEPRTLETIDRWFDAKAQSKYPVIAAIDESDALLGFSSYGPFRAWPAYKYTIEHCIYVHRDARGKGVGKALLVKLIRTAEEQGYHTIMAGIDATNVASIALHKGQGFGFCGTLREVGFKFGDWLDLAFYQKILNAPAKPVDG